MRIILKWKSFKIIFYEQYIFFKGESLVISSEFNDGDVIFTWDNVSSSYLVLYRTTTGEQWGQEFSKTIQSTKYTVRNALLYDSIYFNVSDPGSNDLFNSTTFEGKSFYSAIMSINTNGELKKKIIISNKLRFKKLKSWSRTHCIVFAV